MDAVCDCKSHALEVEYYEDIDMYSLYIRSLGKKDKDIRYEQVCT